MKDKDLHKLSRTDLLKLLMDQMEENRLLKLQLDSVMAQLEHQNLQLLEAGTLAEAALRLSGIFEAADAAANAYLNNIRRMA